MPAGLLRVVYAFQYLSVQVETVRPAVSGPAPFQGLRLIGGGNIEFGKCDDHGSDAYVRFGGRTNMPALRTPDDGSTDVPGRADVMQHGIELVPQFDDIGEGEVRTPPPAEFCDHLRKPGSLRVTGWHLRLIVHPSRGSGAKPPFSDKPTLRPLEEVDLPSRNCGGGYSVRHHPCMSE